MLYFDRGCAALFAQTPLTSSQGCRETDRRRCQIRQKKMPEDARYGKGKIHPLYFSSEQFYCIFINKYFPDFSKIILFPIFAAFLKVGLKLRLLLWRTESITRDEENFCGAPQAEIFFLMLKFSGSYLLQNLTFHENDQKMPVMPDFGLAS